jgi:hypothetical protein
MVRQKRIKVKKNKGIIKTDGAFRIAVTHRHLS